MHHKFLSDSDCWEVNQAGTDCSRRTNDLVGATGEQRRQHHQIGKREQPLLRLRAGCFCCSCDHAQVAAPREIVNMLNADARQAGYYRVRKNLLTRLHRNQRGPRLLEVLRPLPCQMLHQRLKDANFPSNSRSVSARGKRAL